MVRVRVIFSVLFFYIVLFMLYFSCCIFPYSIYSLYSELTLTMQNIDVTQETTSQLRADQNWLKTKLQKRAEEKQIGFDHECTWDGLNIGQRREISLSMEKVKWRHSWREKQKKKNVYVVFLNIVFSTCCIFHVLCIL